MHFQMVLLVSSLLLGAPPANGATAPTSLEDAFKSALAKSEALKQSEERSTRATSAWDKGGAVFFPIFPFN
jgi:hypothetical protein